MEDSSLKISQPQSRVVGMEHRFEVTAVPAAKPRVRTEVFLVVHDVGKSDGFRKAGPAMAW